MGGISPSIFLRQIISSDLRFDNVNSPVHNLATTVARFLYLGPYLDDLAGVIPTRRHRTTTQNVEVRVWVWPLDAAR